MMSLICRLIGHRLSIIGVTGKFAWCRRCAARLYVEPPIDE